MDFVLESTSFRSYGEIPQRHTCDGEDVSPPLSWRGTPPGTLSLALIVDDPDAPDPKSPQMVWVHWVVYNLPVGLDAIAEGASGSRPSKGSTIFTGGAGADRVRRSADTGTSTSCMPSIVSSSRSARLPSPISSG